MENFSLFSLILFSVIIFFSGLVHGTLGLGFPLLATPLLAIFLDIQTAILVTLLPTVAVNIASIIRGGEWGDSIGKFWPLAVYVMTGSAIGTSLIIISDPVPFKLLLAFLIFLYLASGWLGSIKMDWIGAYRGWSMLAFGFLAGIAGGSTNVMVPILIIYTMELGLTATAMVQVFNMCFLAGKLTQIGTFAGTGLLGLNFLLSTIPLAGVGLVALFLGMSMQRRISTHNYKVIVKGILFIIALILIAQYFLQRQSTM